jgi:uncharacterized membrane protein
MLYRISQVYYCTLAKYLNKKSNTKVYRTGVVLPVGIIVSVTSPLDYGTIHTWPLIRISAIIEHSTDPDSDPSENDPKVC